VIDLETIKKQLQINLPDAQITLRDLTGGKDHYEMEIVSTAFHAVTPVNRHRLVYGALKTFLDSGVLHALTFKTRTPDEK